MACVRATKIEVRNSTGVYTVDLDVLLRAYFQLSEFRLFLKQREGTASSQDVQGQDLGMPANP